MSEVGDAFATARAGETGGAEVELLEEPEAEQEHGGNLDEGEEEDDEHER